MRSAARRESSCALSAVSMAAPEQAGQEAAVGRDRQVAAPSWRKPSELEGIQPPESRCEQTHRPSQQRGRGYDVAKRDVRVHARLAPLAPDLRARRAVSLATARRASPRQA